MQPSAHVGHWSAVVFYAFSAVSAGYLLYGLGDAARLVHMAATCAFLVWNVNYALYVRRVTRRWPQFVGFNIAAAALSVFGVVSSFVELGDAIAVWWLVDTVVCGGLIFVVEAVRALRAGSTRSAVTKGT